MNSPLDQFREIWYCDFEFGQPPGESPQVRCLVAKELRTGQVLRLWADQLSQQSAPPFATDSTSLLVAYFLSAEMNCFLALGWKLPYYVLDLFVEFRNITNGKPVPAGVGLLGALTYYGLDGLAVVEKEDMRKLALRGGPYTETEKVALLDYCESDVKALEKLLPCMLPQIDLPRALYRGRYMKTVAVMETNGIPIDVPTLDRLRDQWDSIKDRLIQEVDASFGLYEGRRFSQQRFSEYLAQRRLFWPRLDSGGLALDDDTFRSMSTNYPQIALLRELRRTLSVMESFDLPVGQDGRSRCMLSPFQSKTGRNQPSNTRFIFGLSAWLRGLIRPEFGRTLAYIDWSQQEFGIAAALSGDVAMTAAYQSGDCYLGFAKSAGAVPPDATKESHPEKRELFKQIILATQYGMTRFGLANRLGLSPMESESLLQQHRRAFPQFWKWSEAAAHCALLGIALRTVFGWTYHPDLRPANGFRAGPNTRSYSNFPVQANGAEMMRLAAILATERGIRVCAPVHDAFLIEMPTEDSETVVAEMQQVMREASRIVLGGLELRSDVAYIHSPDRYMDKRGVTMWDRVVHLMRSSDVFRKDFC
ncbi:MAG: DNA polymerase [Thermoguttaceae bacterium]